MLGVNVENGKICASSIEGNLWEHVEELREVLGKMGINEDNVREIAWETMKLLRTKKENETWRIVEFLRDLEKNGDKKNKRLASLIIDKIENILIEEFLWELEEKYEGKYEGTTKQIIEEVEQMIINHFEEAREEIEAVYNLTVNTLIINCMEDIEGILVILDKYKQWREGEAI